MSRQPKASEVKKPVDMGDMGLTEQTQRRRWARLRLYACVAAFGVMVGTVAAMYSSKLVPDPQPVDPVSRPDVEPPTKSTVTHTPSQVIRFVSDQVAPTQVTTDPREL